ncbi:MAG: hypothetical protein AABY09_01040, partial [Nanoarchaeota archaeon]
SETYPEYILIAVDATDETAESPTTFQSDTSFVVYKEGPAVPEDVDTSVASISEDITPIGTDEQMGTGTTGSQYRAGAGRDTTSDTEGVAGPVCGDGTCDLTEDAQTCPDDCAEKGSSILIIIIIFVVLLVGGGLGFFLWRRHRNNAVAEAAKKAEEQKKALAAQPAKLAQTAQAAVQKPVQQQTIVQPKSPFANDGQLNATVNFIRTARSQGLSDDKIKAMLRNGNYNPQQIDYAFANVK